MPQAESLYGLQHGSDHFAAQSYPDYLDLRDRNRSFDGLAAYNIAAAGLDTGEQSIRAWVNEASGNYFDALRIQPYLGRFFHASDEHGPEQRSVYRAQLRVLAQPIFTMIVAWWAVWFS